MEQISSLPVAPMLYNGISYFPIEAIMRTLGATISWDAPTRTLKIMTPNFIPSDVIPPSTAPTILPSATVPAAPAATAAPATPTATETPAVNSQTMLIRDIEPYRLENMIAFTEEEPSWMMGASYPYAFSTDGSREINEGNAYFNLGGSYYSISGLYGPRDSTQSRSFLTVLNIYGDTRLLATYEILTEDGIKSFTLNVAGVSQLRFEFLCMDSEGKRANVDSAFVDNRSWYFGLANVVLTKSGDAKTYANQPLGVYGATATLSQEIKLYRKSSNMAELTRAAAGTIMGNEYSSGFATISNEYFANGFAYYNINNKYKSFSASYGPLDSTAQGSAVILQVYGGDTLLNEYTIKSGEPLRELYLDVTGVTRLRFRFWQIDADGKNIDRRGCAFAVVNPTLR
jgi:hypothetical protein